LGALPLLVGRLPFREGRSPSKLDGLATDGAEQMATHIQRDGSLPVAKVRHHRCQVGASDQVEQPSLVRRQARPDFAQGVHRVDVGDDGVVAGADQPFVMERAARPAPSDQRLGHRNGPEGSADPKPGDNPRHVRDQALRQVAGLRARVGDNLLALAVIEFLGNLQRSGRRPAEARAAQFLQRWQVVQPRRPLTLVLNPDLERPLEAFGECGDSHGVLAL